MGAELDLAAAEEGLRWILSMRQWAYTVTFEAPDSLRPPVVVRGEVASTEAPKAASRAVAEASRLRPRTTWDDVVLLLEKLPRPERNDSA